MSPNWAYAWAAQPGTDSNDSTQNSKPRMRQFCPSFQPERHMGFLTGKKFLITGVLSNRSIAYGIARACHQQGAELAFSYVGERFLERTREFASEFGSSLIFDCDVGDDAQITAMFEQLGQ